MKSEILSNKNLCKITMAECLSSFGDNLDYVALCILCYSLSGSVISIGILSLMSSIPNIIFTLIGGVVSDKINKKKLIIAMQVVRGTLVLTMPIMYIAGILSNIYIYIITFLVSICESFYMPCSNAFTLDITDDEKYLKVNSEKNSLNQVVTVLGLTCGGFLVGCLGPSFAIFFDAGTFFIAALITSTIEYNKDNLDKGMDICNVFNLKNILKEIKEGLQIINKEKNIKIYMINFVIICILVAPLEPYITYMLNNIGLDDKYSDLGVGILFSMLSIGVILGNLLIIKLKDKYTNYKIVKYAILLTLITVMLICINNLITLCVSIFLLGLSSGLLKSLSVTIIMTGVEENFRGRISSCILLSALSISPLISIVASSFIELNFREGIWILDIFLLLGFMLIFKKNKSILLINTDD
ncbi:MAG: MFS transporter [Clostridium sp.]|nr:MFS transporter [Clostridium sp.]